MQDLAKRISASLCWPIFRAELVAEPPRFRIPGGIQLDWTAAIKIGIIKRWKNVDKIKQLLNPNLLHSKQVFLLQSMETY